MTNIINNSSNNNNSNNTLDESKIPPNLPDSVDRLPDDVNHQSVVRNYIGGKFVPPVDGQYIVNRNPATGDIVSYIPRSKDSDVDNAVKCALEAHKSGVWRFKSEEERALVLDEIADKLESRLEELANMESTDCGKPISLARSLDIPRAVANFRFFAGAIRHQSTDCHTMGHSAINYTLRRPVGVCGLITPWNLPLYLLSWKVAPALATGNVVVAKASELTPMTANALAEIMDTVKGLPKGVFNLVHGYGRECGSAITAHDDVKLVSFTGGTETGRVVGRIASEKFKKLSLELGGKNPMIVFDDCNLDEVVHLAKRASFTNQGEVCLCCSRILVQDSIYDKFMEKFIPLVEGIKVGDPSDPNTDMGAVISPQHLEKIEFYINLAKQEGGKIRIGGERSDIVREDRFKNGAFLQPTIISDISPDSRVSTEEIFGPVVVVHKFKDDAEAIEIANNVKYGLCASVMTNNLQRAHKVSDHIETGMVWVNTWLMRDLRVPFGGTKSSGMGREGGNYSLEFFTEDKNVLIKL